MSLGTALAAFYTVGWIPLFVLRAETMSDALTEYDRRERATVVATSVLISLHVTLACVTLAFAGRPIAYWAAAAMVALDLAAIALYLWARRLIAPFGVRPQPDETPEVLCRHGAFGLVRNPLYLSMLIATGAPLFAVPRNTLFVTFGLGAAALAMRSLQDERRLLAQLGAPYADYCRAVKRLIPYLW